ncbi:hypothetical protein [Fuerstiella marisgermanici]|uniref:hypothetical protein n=1 Tax=Fuerstiella marisgermanici TaxID=1891926 RepID=UPI001E2D25DF|nr:hypothetical protein [Fuerstiella marisgermanici]
MIKTAIKKVRAILDAQSPAADYLTSVAESGETDRAKAQAAYHATILSLSRDQQPELPATEL